MIRFCNQCGAPVRLTIPEGDSLHRHVCTACDYIQYQNPKLVVGCVAEWEGKILLCRRAIEPRYGFWTLPAGFMENEESTAEAALRETQEEAGALVIDHAMFALVNVPQISQVHMFYRGKLANGNCAPGVESLAVELFSEEAIPWGELAFRSVRFCLERYFVDRSRGHFGVHETELEPIPELTPLVESN